MELRNYTPFIPLCFESRDPQRMDFGVCVLRGGFDIIPGQRLRPREDQAPLVMADEYHGEPGESSLRIETNLAPFKPKTDIHVEAIATSPDGQPRPRWRVGIQIGHIQRLLEVTGPRGWQKSLGRWSLSEPKPITDLPLRYEYAYGGGWPLLAQGGEACMENPTGLGYPDPRLRASPDWVQAPQIVDPAQADPAFNTPIAVKGLGPMPPSWSPRLQYAGTFDAVWEKTRWPELPEDFDYAFYNSAHPDLIYPGYVAGNEEVRALNLSPVPQLRFWLPGYQLGLLARLENGRINLLPMQLDSLHFDLIQMRAYLTWRGLYAIAEPLRVLEIRLRNPEATADAGSETATPQGQVRAASPQTV